MLTRAIFLFLGKLLAQHRVMSTGIQTRISTIQEKWIGMTISCLRGISENTIYSIRCSLNLNALYAFPLWAVYFNSQNNQCYQALPKTARAFLCSCFCRAHTQNYRIFLTSIRIDAKKRIKYTIWGNISISGTSRGNAMNVGRSTVNVGMLRIRLELCG